MTLGVAFVVAGCSAAADNATLDQDGNYFPPTGDWERKAPADVGVNAERLQAAIDFAIESENPQPRELSAALLQSWGREPHNEIIGPVEPRGDVTGIIVKDGYIIAEWGDLEAVDMTFSVSKSFLSTTVGLAYDRDLIPDLHRPVREQVLAEMFESDLNRQITWDHLLRQTSDWEGTLWDKPDWADRPPPASRMSIEEYRAREHNIPGTAYKYNDVRVNLLALAALHVWQRPLPEVLAEHVMGPIGATDTWHWEGYTNSYVDIGGEQVQSVSGGGHWGGGMFINALDQARFGYLTLRNGKWNGETILSDEWMDLARTPTDVNPGYGFMNFFLNGPDVERKRFPSAPATAYAHLGAGTNMVYVDQENDLVIVARWVAGPGVLDGIVQRVLAAIDSDEGVTDEPEGEGEHTLNIRCGSRTSRINVRSIGRLAHQPHQRAIYRSRLALTFVASGTTTGGVRPTSASRRYRRPKPDATHPRPSQR